MLISVALVVIIAFAVMADAFQVVSPSPRLSVTSVTTTVLYAEILSSSSSPMRRDFCQTLATSVLAAATTTATTTTTTAVGAATATAGAALLFPDQALAATITTAATIDLPRMGLGAWAWGDSLFWGYNAKNDDELRKVFDFAIQNNKSNEKVLLDTAEIYGFGRSETLIGQFAKAYPEDKIQVQNCFLFYNIMCCCC
jgi:Aldo/keto reductase family